MEDIHLRKSRVWTPQIDCNVSRHRGKREEHQQYHYYPQRVSRVSYHRAMKGEGQIKRHFRFSTKIWRKALKPYIPFNLAMIRFYDLKIKSRVGANLLGKFLL